MKGWFWLSNFVIIRALLWPTAAGTVWWNGEPVWVPAAKNGRRNPTRCGRTKSPLQIASSCSRAGLPIQLSILPRWRTVPLCALGTITSTGRSSFASYSGWLKYASFHFQNLRHRYVRFCLSTDVFEGGKLIANAVKMDKKIPDITVSGGIFWELTNKK